VTYVVASIARGRPETAAAFRWDEGGQDFVTVDLGLALPIPAEGRS
jgi:hypothetical protein